MRLPNTLLHIDNDLVFTRSIGERLQKAGIESHALNDRALWRESVLNLDVGIVLLDLNLTAMQGLELTEQIRRLDGDRRVILFCDNPDNSQVLSALSQDVDYCFFKSEYDFNELIGAIHAVQFQRVHWHRAIHTVQSHHRSVESAKMTDDNSKLRSTPRMLPAVNDSKASVLSESFPRFLINACQISLDTLMKAVEFSDRQRPLLGQLALESGKLTMRQIFQIVEDQAKTHEPFGKIGVRLGMLTCSDVDQLLDMQRDRRSDIGNSLVSIGAITADQLAQYQEAYRHHMLSPTGLLDSENAEAFSTSA